MKNVVIVLSLALLAVVGVQLADVHTSEAASVRKAYIHNNGAVGGTTNSSTTILKMEVTCTAAICTFGLRQYASAASGPILDDNVYSLTVTAGTHTFDAITWQGQVKNNFPNGAYYSSITGASRAHIWFLK